MVLLASLFVRTPSPFEPLAIDRTPSGLVRVASALIPGLAQVMLGRSVRGLLLLAPFVHLGQKVFSTVFSGAGDLQVLALREFSAGTDGPSLQAWAELTAETVSAIPEVRDRHILELSVLLALLSTSSPGSTWPACAGTSGPCPTTRRASPARAARGAPTHGPTSSRGLALILLLTPSPARRRGRSPRRRAVRRHADGHLLTSNT